MLGVAIGSVTVLALHARGHSQAAYALSAAGILMGGTIGAVRLLAEG